MLLPEDIQLGSVTDLAGDGDVGPIMKSVWRAVWLMPRPSSCSVVVSIHPETTLGTPGAPGEMAGRVFVQERGKVCPAGLANEGAVVNECDFTEAQRSLVGGELGPDRLRPAAGRPQSGRQQE
jgi:hypothetical protein